ncbi:MAG TPA: hypothetical protein VJ276_02010 [Thermoanaerobaculia bacterium]|nr:hypothetical protein [Thermoanaerobaculia bacterium]
MKAWSAVALLFVLAWSSVAAADEVQCGIDDKLATISFERTVTDVDVITLLARYQVVPYAAYLWTAGQLVAVRISTDQAGNAVGSVRSATEAARGLERANVTAQAKAFLAQHTRGDVIRDEELFEQAKEILRQAALNDAILTRVRTNKPLIYAVAVCAAPETLAAIAQKEGVKVTDDAAPLRPEQLSTRFPTPKIDILSAAQAYAQLTALAKP